MRVAFIFKILSLFCLFLSQVVSAHDLVDGAKKLKSSVVGIGTFDPLRAPVNKLVGTGFSIGNGYYIATNHHVIEIDMNESSSERLVVFWGEGNKPQILDAELVVTDPAHDLAILRIERPIPPLPLSKAERLADGSHVAFTGFPLGAVLGLYPATHSGFIAAYTPVANPSNNASQLSQEMLRRLRDPFFIYQLDATAYPGNSGSPVLDLNNMEVIGVLNKVFVKQTKESAISDPSGISYAVPIPFLIDLYKTIKVEQ